MADKLSQLGLGSEVRELKIGSSFTRNPSSSFHTIRYDFKPASVDPSKMGMLEVGESNAVTVKVPHMNGTEVTNFNGHAKESNKKECVLIFDSETGEFTLEKISSQILLKKTRPERPEKNSLAPPIPQTSSNSSSTFNQKKFSKSSPVSTVSPIHTNSPKMHSNYNNHKGGGGYSSNNGPPNVVRETLEDLDDETSMPSSLFDMDGDFVTAEPTPPPPPKPKMASSSYNKSVTKPPQQQHSKAQPKPLPPPPPQTNKATHKELSDSSSSDSSSDSDSDSDGFEEVRPSNNQPNSSSSSASSNGLMSMPSFSTSPPRNNPVEKSPMKQRNGGNGAAPPAPSMSSLILSDDLQLSESEDSD